VSNGLGIPLHLNLNAFGGIQHTARELQLVGKTIHKRAKASALGDAGNANLFTNGQRTAPPKL